ncbi:MAG: formylglycine-generating enzyme family protein [Burkholderiaceae bacterium]|jgi:formylglycine-generating enzyme required for sulfatase activity|nr:formylglycine-generating enzyme family protein [Burkholderiaceae bacterium]
MEFLKWVGVAVGAAVGGYYGQQLIGWWAGGAAGFVGVAIFLSLLLKGQWLMSILAFVAGFWALFSLIGEAPPAAKTPLSPASQAATPGSAQRAAQESLPAVAPASRAVRSDEPSPRPTALPESVTRDGAIRDCPQCPELVNIPPGSFQMGSTPGKAIAGRTVDAREGPVHRVSVASFAAGRHAVTRAEFSAFVQRTGHKTDAERDGGCFVWSSGEWALRAGTSWRNSLLKQADNHPVVCVSWDDAQAYVKWLSQETRRNYRLLSEAEREYVARAATTTLFWWGDELTPDKANYQTSAPDFQGSAKGPWRQSTTPVHQFDPNPFGLYQVHGNVWEWVQDCHHDSYQGAPANGSAWTEKCASPARVLRGGAWVGDPADLRASSRLWLSPAMRLQAAGFRVARDLTKP